jgi:hypothetical protein
MEWCLAEIAARTAGVGDAVRRQVSEFEEHFLQATGDHENQQPAASGTGSCMTDTRTDSE